MSYIGNSPGVASQRIVTIRTATAGQTEFFPDSGYVLGYIDVIIGGVDMTPGVDYTANDGVKVVLTEAAEAGEIVKLIAYIPRGLSDGYLKSEADALLALKADLVGGKIPSAQLPAYVDDVLEYTNLSSFPATGEQGKVYIAQDTNLCYRWSGSVYIVLTDLSNYYTKTQADNLLATKLTKSSNLSDLTDAAAARSNLGLGNVENKSSVTIRGEINSGNVTNALGYTPVNKAGDTMSGPLVQQAASAKTYGYTGTPTGTCVTPGTTLGEIQLKAYYSGTQSAGLNYGAAITFSPHDLNASLNAQGGIYFVGDGTYGTKVAIATTDNFSIGSKGRLFIDHVGRVTIPAQPCFYVWSYLYSPQKTYSSEVIFNDYTSNSLNVITNIGNNFSSSTGRFTAPCSGTYTFSGSFSRSGGNATIDMYLNGSSIGTRHLSYGGDWQTVSITCELALSASDFVELRFGGTNATTTSGYRIQFSGRMVS